MEAAYRRGDLFEKRRSLMNEWADFCRQKRSDDRTALPWSVMIRFVALEPQEVKAKPKKPVGLRSSPATHSNLYLDYLAERDAFADGRRKWDALKTEDRANCPPGVEAETEATLTGDLSVMAEFDRPATRQTGCSTDMGKSPRQFPPIR